MKRTLLALSLMVLPSALLAQGGGNRPDLNQPGLLSKLRESVQPFKLDSRIQKSAQEIHRLKQLEEAASDEPRFMRKSEREQTAEEMDAEREKLKNLLSSTPTVLTSEAQKLISPKDTSDVARSNVEILEIGRAMANRQNLLAGYRERLKALQEKTKLEPADLDVAVEYYTVYAEVATALREMAEEFAQGADGKYGRRIRELIARSEERIEELEQVKKNQPPEFRKKYEKLQSNARKLQPALETALGFLDRQKEWAKDRAKSFAADEQLAHQSLKTAELSRDVKLAIQEIVADFKSINEPLPPLIIFDLSTTDLESVPDTPQAGERQEREKRIRTRGE